MAFNDLERKRIENGLAAFINSIRPPAHIRPELDYGYRLSGQSVELLEIRPHWDDPTIIQQHAFAKATFVQAQKCWKIYWMRQTLKWHSYEPAPVVASLAAFLKVVSTDEYHCFFG